MKSSRSGLSPFFILLILIAALGIRLAFFGISLQTLPASADEANGVLTAKNIARGEFPLLVTGSPYQFPVESYLLNPLVRFLPRNVFGARYIAVLTGLVSAAGFLLIGLLSFTHRRSWPGLLLLLFPSAYWLLWQAAYIPTNYNPALMLCVLGLLLIFLSRRKPRVQLQLCFLGGILLGLAFCGIMLYLPFLLMSGLYVFFEGNWRKGLKGMGGYVSGLAIGLMPYYFAGWLIPGANQAVSGSYPWLAVFQRAWPLMQHNLPVAMGITPCLYPDFKATLTLIPGLAFPLTILVLLLLVTVTVMRKGYHLKRLFQGKGLSLDGIDVFLGISWLCLIFFILSRRSHFHTYRYILPLVWSFPFLVGYLYSTAGRGFRMVIGWGTILLVLLNLAIGFELMHIWSKPDFAAKEADMPDLRPAIQCLDRLTINRAYASMWVASRIAYETDERILCTQPYNTRFDGWPVLYKQEVDRSSKTAYVLTHSDRFTIDRFEDDLKAMDVFCQSRICGAFTIYTDFKTDREAPGRVLPKNDLVIESSHNNTSAGLLHDGGKAERWGSHHPQEKGMWIEIILSTAKRLSGVRLYYNQYAHDLVPSLKVSARKGKEWVVLLPEVPGRLDRFIFLNNHPVYGEKMQTISFPEIETKALHFEITEGNPKRDWSLVEIELYQKKGNLSQAEPFKNPNR